MERWLRDDDGFATQDGFPFKIDGVSVVPGGARCLSSGQYCSVVVCNLICR